MLETSGECVLCDGQLKRNGKTSAGSTRWLCKGCGASSSNSVARSDVARRHELNQFLGWLLGKHSQAEVTRTATGRTLRHRTGWCWNIVPSFPGTGEIHAEVQLDGIYLRGGGCCLIAISGGHVIGWPWSDTEKKAAWVALIERFPPEDRPALTCALTGADEDFHPGPGRDLAPGPELLARGQ